MKKEKKTIIIEEGEMLSKLLDISIELNVPFSAADVIVEFYRKYECTNKIVADRVLTIYFDKRNPIAGEKWVHYCQKNLQYPN